MMQIATAVACVAFAGMAVGAVVVDRSVAPVGVAKLPPAPPANGGAVEDDGYKPSSALIASGLSAVAKLEPVEESPVEGGKQAPGQVPPPQDIVLVAAIGQPGSMMAVIREGAAQMAIAEGQRGGSVEVLEVRPGYARVRHRGQERELTIGTPMLMVSDMSTSGEAGTGSQIITPPVAGSKAETYEEQGITRTRVPTTAMQRSQAGANPGSGQGGQSGRGGGGNSGATRRGAGTAGGNGNGNGQSSPDGEADR